MSNNNTVLTVLNITGNYLPLTLKNIADISGGDAHNNYVLAPGPEHSENDRSLKITPTPGAPDNLLVHSFSGDDPIKCKNYILCKLKSVDPANIPTLPDQPQNNVVKQLTGQWIYTDENCSPIMKTERFDRVNGGKDIYQYRYENGQFIPGLNGIKTVPYYLPGIQWAIQNNKYVYIVEGEKCAHTLIDQKEIATTNPGGAGKWKPEHSPWFEGAHVIIIPDNDETGKKHAKQVHDSLNGIAASRLIIELPELEEKEDIHDWFRTGKTLNDFHHVIQVDIERQSRRKKQIEENITIGNTSIGTPLPNLMSLTSMKENLVFVSTGSYVANRQNGKVLRFPDMRNNLKASQTTITPPNGKPKFVESINLWVQSDKRITVDVVTWAPGQPEYCPAPDRQMGADTAFNMWTGLPPYMPPVDWQERCKVFDEHISYLIPNTSECEHFIQWIAHILQRPGILPHTAYVMIATTHGIGRNWLASVLTRMLRGYVAAGVDLTRVIDSDYNGQISQKLLAIVDEAHEGMDSRKYERGKTLRRIITEENRFVNIKYGCQYHEMNACRWLCFSNYEDALPFDENDRRFRLIENPEQRQSSEYYKRLYSALNDQNFINSVRYKLEKIDLSNFNPGEHAPWNEMKIHSLDSMTSEVDRLVRQFKDEWPGYFVTNSIVRQFVKYNLNEEAELKDASLKYAMRRAGFKSTNKVIKIANKSYRVSIVKNMKRTMIEAMEPGVLQWYVNHWCLWFYGDDNHKINNPLQLPF